MLQSRRRWFGTIPGALALLAFAELGKAQMRPSAQPMPSPNAPNPHAPAGLDRPPIGSSADKRGLDPKLQQEIKADVVQLFVLASELKKEVEATDSNSVLALGIVNKAKEIEKLAKRVRERAKG
jgi:hypothetical protein